MSPESRVTLAITTVGRTSAAGPGAATVELDAASLPFGRPSRATRPTRPIRVQIRDLHLAFPNHQTLGTRLVLTQSTYLLQKWIDTLREGDEIVATADEAALKQNAPEAFQGRGPWRYFDVQRQTAEDAEAAEEKTVLTSASSASSAVETLLARAYASPSAAERFSLCGGAVAAAPDSAAAWLALASAARESQESAPARHALDEALRLAPDWEAVHYEDGKFWLALDDLPRARDGFRRACDLMPTFAAAFSNLGATSGELGDTEAAVAAFEQALRADPDNVTVLNNVGVVSRELGRLVESEAALRRVVALAPDFVFGYYNLGHTLFLSGHDGAALEAYEEGQRRDPEKNRRQGCRLAIVRFANGDMEGAERDLSRATTGAPADEREDLLLEAYEITKALLDATPALAVHQKFLDGIAARIMEAP